MNIDEKGWLYGKWQIRQDFWAITNRFTNIMYLLVGEDRALLIDTGYGEGNIRAFVETITQKPLVVISTHGHFDHTGGNGWWPEIWMAEGSFADCRHTFLPITPAASPCWIKRTACCSRATNWKAGRCCC